MNQSLFIPGSPNFNHQPSWYANFSAQKLTFPGGEKQTFSAWYEIARKAVNRDSILVCHSLGTRVGWAIMEELQVAGAIMIAPPFQAEYELWQKVINGQGEGAGRESLDSFFKNEYDWQAIIRHSSGRIRLLFSEDDPFIPEYHADRFFRALGLPVNIFNHQLHFDRENAWPAIESALENLKSEILLTDPECQAMRAVAHELD